MSKHIASLPPAPSSKRSRIFYIRLNDTEREEIEALAKQLQMPDSTMARHFVMEAVAFHSQQKQEESIVNRQKRKLVTSQLLYKR
jgi:hypothetical protein